MTKASFAVLGLTNDGGLICVTLVHPVVSATQEHAAGPEQPICKSEGAGRTSSPSSIARVKEKDATATCYRLTGRRLTLGDRQCSGTPTHDSSPNVGMCASGRWRKCAPTSSRVSENFTVWFRGRLPEGPLMAGCGPSRARVRGAAYAALQPLDDRRRGRPAWITAALAPHIRRL
jgi:hypothetical protein